MRIDYLLWKPIAKLVLLLTMGVTMSADAGLFDHSKGWKEEVLSHDGRVIVVERHFNLGSYPSPDAHERALLDETITFTLPESNKKISWKTEFKNDVPEPNSLSPLLLDVVGGIPYLATSPAGCIAYNKWGRPNPPYVLFKYVNDDWRRIPLEEFPAALVHANLMSTPDSRQLKSYYTVEQVKAQMQGRNIDAAAKTILREAIPKNRLCPEWVYFEGNWVSPSYIENKKRYQQLILNEQESKKRATDEDAKKSTK
jgi:hypothetical protein